MVDGMMSAAAVTAQIASYNCAVIIAGDKFIWSALDSTSSHRECRAAADYALLKTNQQRELTIEGYDVQLLPVILGSAGTLYKCFERMAREMQIPHARKKKLSSKLHLHSIHTLQNLVSQRRFLERAPASPEARGRIRGR